MAKNSSESYSHPSTAKREDGGECSGPHKDRTKPKMNQVFAPRDANTHERAVHRMNRYVLPVNAGRPANAPRDCQDHESFPIRRRADLEIVGARGIYLGGALGHANGTLSLPPRGLTFLSRDRS